MTFYQYVIESTVFLIIPFAELVKARHQQHVSLHHVHERGKQNDDPIHLVTSKTLCSWLKGQFSKNLPLIYPHVFTKPQEFPFFMEHRCDVTDQQYLDHTTYNESE